MIYDFFTGFDAQLRSWVFLISAQLAAGWLMPILRSLVVLVVVLYGYAIFTGRVQSPLAESIKRLLLITVIGTFAVYPVQLIGNLTYPFFSSAPFDLAAMIPGPPTSWGGMGPPLDTGTIYRRLDDILESAFVTAGGMMTEAGWEVLPFVHGFAIMIATIVMVGYAMFLIVLSKFAIALLVGLTPIFLATLFFAVTKGLFERWLGLLFQYALVPILSLAILSFGTMWMTRQLNALTTAGPDPTVADVAIYVLAAVVSFLLLLQVPQMCASIGGGLAISTLGFAKAAETNTRAQMQRVAGYFGARREAAKQAQREHATTHRQQDEARWRDSMSRDLKHIASRQPRT